MKTVLRLACGLLFAVGSAAHAQKAEPLLKVRQTARPARPLYQFPVRESAGHDMRIGATYGSMLGGLAGGLALVIVSEQGCSVPPCTQTWDVKQSTTVVVSSAVGGALIGAFVGYEYHKRKEKAAAGR